MLHVPAKRGLFKALGLLTLSALLYSMMGIICIRFASHSVTTPPASFSATLYGLLNQLFILGLGARLLCSPPPQKVQTLHSVKKKRIKKAPEGAIFSSFPNAAA